MLLQLYLIGCFVSFTLCLIPILKGLVNKELLNILDIIIILIIGFVVSWFGVYAYIQYGIKNRLF